MDWLQSIQSSIHFMEDNLTENISTEDVFHQVFASESHFQRMFTLIAGLPVGEYLRNRRLSMAGQELLRGDSKVIDVAFKYQYETPESFSKAFYRFHGMNPSEVRKKASMLKMFLPLTIHISIQGGFIMEKSKIDEFCWNNEIDESGSEKERYHRLVNWALQARCTNPNVFDALTEWIQSDSEWTKDKLLQNRQILVEGVLNRFRKQNEVLRAELLKLKPSGEVNDAVFRKLDRFDDALSGKCQFANLSEAAAKMYTDFNYMEKPELRKLIAGEKTGDSGTDSVDVFGYINYLKECDAGVQWTLFMPEDVERKQNGFRVDSFEYLRLPSMRFIGFEGEEYTDVALRLAMMKKLDELTEYRSGFDYDLFFMHFYGQGVDVGTWHGVFGRFFKADTPVPEGFISFDFLPDAEDIQGPPYLSRFAFAKFSGDSKAMHQSEGFDGDAMYDTTRNIILAQGGGIPYPAKYWTAEVFFDGCDKDSTGYLFSGELE